MSATLAAVPEDDDTEQFTLQITLPKRLEGFALKNASKLWTPKTLKEHMLVTGRFEGRVKGAKLDFDDASKSAWLVEVLDAELED